MYLWTISCSTNCQIPTWRLRNPRQLHLEVQPTGSRDWNQWVHTLKLDLKLPSLFSGSIERTMFKLLLTLKIDKDWLMTGRTLCNCRILLWMGGIGWLVRFWRRAGTFLPVFRVNFLILVLMFPLPPTKVTRFTLQGVYPRSRCLICIFLSHKRSICARLEIRLDGWRIDWMY